MGGRGGGLNKFHASGRGLIRGGSVLVEGGTYLRGGLIEDLR